MSKLSLLLGKGKDVKLTEEVTINIKPLKVKDLDLFIQLNDDSKRTQALQQIIERTLKQSEPDATEDELNGIALAYMEPLLNAILEVNGMSDAKSVPK